MAIVEMRVHMDCSGCQSKIKKALQKLNGVDSIDIDMEMQKVTVTGWADQRKVLRAVRKTGRQAEFWPFPCNPEYHDFLARYYTHRNYFQTTHRMEFEQPSSPHYNGYQHYYQRPSSSYNYREHGYNGHAHGYFQQPPYSTIFDEETGSLFNDDNTSACSIM